MLLAQWIDIELKRFKPLYGSDEHPGGRFIWVAARTTLLYMQKACAFRVVPSIILDY